MAAKPQKKPTKTSKPTKAKPAEKQDAIAQPQPIGEKHVEWTWLPIDDVRPYERNARVHSPAQIEQIKASLDTFGWQNAILVDANRVVIAGHGRLEGARARGDKVVPVVVATDLDEMQVRLYRLADNKIALNSAWDEDLLSAEMTDLAALDLNLNVTGFDGLELDKLLTHFLGDDGGGMTDPDEAPEPQPNPVTVPGDIWLLGSHRIICGSSTDAATVAAVLAGAKPHLMVTDPPYGVEYDPDWRNKAERANGKKIGAKAVGVVSNDDKADWREAWALFPGDVAYVWHAGNKADIVARSLNECRFAIRAQIVWAKNQLVIGRGDYHPKHEPCWYAVRDGKTGHWNGDRKQTTLWEIDKPRKSETGHSTQKPVECMLRPIRNNSQPGDAVYEPFSGSGTTIIAAEMSKRRCHAVELNPAYVDVAVKRWQEFTGQEAVHEKSGATFAAIQAMRKAA
jgi:DNA modification methylase